MGMFTGKTVFITGASRGIGLCIKNEFEKECANIIAPSRKELDLSSGESIKDYINNNDLSHTDIFIHCAGINIKAGLDEINEAIIEEVFEVNLFSAIYLLKPISEGMKNRKNGKIIFISSLYSVVSKERRIAYSASKNALTGLAKTLTLEMAPYGILTNCVAPGYVMTDMTRNNLSREDIIRIENEIPTGRFQTEKEISDLVVFLCSDKNQSITGQLIAVDGGFLCK
jgi:3-oxoacyl-[acyl-carrier protein] reductase